MAARNHYSEAQRAMVGAKLKSLYEERAKERQRAAGGDHGNQHTGGKVAVVQNSAPASDSGKSRDKAEEVLRNAHYPLTKAYESRKNCSEMSSGIHSIPAPAKTRVRGDHDHAGWYIIAIKK